MIFASNKFAEEVQAQRFMFMTNADAPFRDYNREDGRTAANMSGLGAKILFDDVQQFVSNWDASDFRQSYIEMSRRLDDEMVARYKSNSTVPDAAESWRRDAAFTKGYAEGISWVRNWMRRYGKSTFAKAAEAFS